MIVGLIAGIGVAFSGHMQAEHLMESRPMKMVASEALWDDSGDPAAWTAFANIDTNKEKNTSEISIPYALSYLAYQKFSGSVKGMKTLQKNMKKRTEKATISRLLKRRSGVSALWRERARL